jgi:hypothetical protein
MNLLKIWWKTRKVQLRTAYCVLPLNQMPLELMEGILRAAFKPDAPRAYGRHTARCVWTRCPSSLWKAYCVLLLNQMPLELMEGILRAAFKPDAPRAYGVCSLFPLKICSFHMDCRSFVWLVMFRVQHRMGERLATRVKILSTIIEWYVESFLTFLVI